MGLCILEIDGIEKGVRGWSFGLRCHRRAATVGGGWAVAVFGWDDGLYLVLSASYVVGLLLIVVGD